LLIKKKKRKKIDFKRYTPRPKKTVASLLKEKLKMVSANSSGGGKRPFHLSTPTQSRTQSPLAFWSAGGRQ